MCTWNILIRSWRMCMHMSCNQMRTYSGLASSIISIVIQIPTTHCSLRRIGGSGTGDRNHHAALRISDLIGRLRKKPTILTARQTVR